MPCKKNRAPRGCHFNEPNYFQSGDYYRRSATLFETWIMQLAINRFRWVGLPDTCNERILEWSLHTHGSAAICRPSDANEPPVFLSLPSVHDGRLTAYGDPTAWRVNGVSGDVHFASDWNNGAWVWYSKSRFSPYNAIQLFARKLAHMSRTEDINLYHQQTPMTIVVPDKMKRDAENVFKQISGGEPAIIANKTFENMDISAINTGVEYIGDALYMAQHNVWNSIYRYLGIEHLAFEKGERIIQEEARGNTYPTNLMLLDCLDARREACDYLNRTFGWECGIYFNNDFESYNFNFVNDIERVTVAGLSQNNNGGDEDGI